MTNHVGAYLYPTKSRWVSRGSSLKNIWPKRLHTLIRSHYPDHQGCYSIGFLEPLRKGGSSEGLQD